MDQFKVMVNVFDLIVGATFDFNSISGKKVKVAIPPKTQPGSKLRLAGEGLPMHNSPHAHGDQYILLKPYIPDIIDIGIIDAIVNSKKEK